MSRHKEMDSLSHGQKGYDCYSHFSSNLTIRTFKIKMCVSYDLAILLPSVYPGEMMRHIYKETSARIFSPAFIGK